MHEINLATGHDDEVLQFSHFGEASFRVLVNSSGFTGQGELAWYEDNYLARIVETIKKMAADMKGAVSIGQESSNIEFKLDNLGHLVVSGELYHPTAWPQQKLSFSFVADFSALEKLAKDFQKLPPSITHYKIK